MRFRYSRAYNCIVALLGLLMLAGWWPGTTVHSAVTLVSLQITPVAGGVLVAWDTASEMQVAAFRLSRSQSKTGPWETLTPLVDPAQDPMTPAHHEFTDSQATSGTYYYRLEEVLSDGSVPPPPRPDINPSGPITLGVSAPTSTSTATAQPTATSTATPVPTATPTHAPSATGTPTASVTPRPSPTAVIWGATYTPRPTEVVWQATNAPRPTPVIWVVTIAPLPSATATQPEVATPAPAAWGAPAQETATPDGSQPTAAFGPAMATPTGITLASSTPVPDLGLTPGPQTESGPTDIPAPLASGFVTTTMVLETGLPDGSAAAATTARSPRAAHTRTPGPQILARVPGSVAEQPVPAAPAEDRAAGVVFFGPYLPWLGGAALGLAALLGAAALALRHLRRL